MTEAVLITDISQLITLSGSPHPRRGSEMKDLGIVSGGCLLIHHGEILACGSPFEARSHPLARRAKKINADGRIALPGFVDSHTHPVFGGNRLRDFEKRLQGASSQEIAREGGGILSTVERTRAAPREELTQKLRSIAQKFLSCGTTTIEAKSGYGLTLQDETKILEVIRQVCQTGPLEIVPTFLGAHAVPKEFSKRPDSYLRQVIETMLPEIAKENLAEFADVFCEKGYFTPEQSEKILRSAHRLGLKLKIHADQLSLSGGSAIAAKLKCLSADHLDWISSSALSSLRSSGTIATLLPAANYLLRLTRYPPARKLIEAKVPVALATDFNPGTSPCWNMQTIIALACTQMRMSTEEALTAATINWAHAVRRGGRIGSLETGKQADVALLDLADYREIPYYFGTNHAWLVIKKGRIVHPDHEETFPF